MTPLKPSGRPSAWRNQSMVTASSSVAAGDVCHSMHCAAKAAVRYSAITDGGLEFAGKYAKNRGCCQWVMPGTIIFSKSEKIASIVSGSSGAEGGS